MGGHKWVSLGHAEGVPDARILVLFHAMDGAVPVLSIEKPKTSTLVPGKLGMIGSVQVYEEVRGVCPYVHI